MKQFRQWIRATMLSLVVAASAQAVPLSTLLAGGTLRGGGLEFTDFSASHSASDPLRVFDPANIDVTAKPGGSPFGAELRFDAGDNELTVRGDGMFAFVGLQMRFRVAAPGSYAVLTMESKTIDMRQQDRGVYIADYLGGHPGDSAGGSAGSAGMADFPGTALQWNFPIPAVPTMDSAGLSPQAGSWVDKNVLVWAVDRADTVALTIFSQRFQLELPEPCSLPLLAIAGLAAAAVLRARRPMT